MAGEQQKGVVEPSAVPGFAVMMLFVSGIVGLVFAWVHAQALGILAAVLAFGIILRVCYR